MVENLCLYLILPHPALSESSLSTTRLSAVSTRWLCVCVCVFVCMCVCVTVCGFGDYLVYISWWSLISVAGKE